MRDRHLLKTMAVVAGLGFLAIIALVIAGGSVGDRRFGKPAGYWGPVLSSVDWCEENYDSTHYVAELHNTVTGFAIALAGVAALFNCVRTGLEKRYYIQSLLLTAVGIGSCAFHLTLHRGMQAADEVPMVWFVFVGAWSVLESTTIKGSRLPAWTPWALVVFLVVISLPNILTEGRLAAAVFHLSFAPVMLLDFVLCLCEMLGTDNADCRLLHRMGVASFAFSFLCWQCDIVACVALQNLPFGLPNPQLHAWGWHLLSGFGIYCLLSANCIARCDVLCRPCSVRWTRLWFPYLVPEEAAAPTTPTKSSIMVSKDPKLRAVRRFVRYMLPPVGLANDRTSAILPAVECPLNTSGSKTGSSEPHITAANPRLDAHRPHQLALSQSLASPDSSVREPSMRKLLRRVSNETPSSTASVRTDRSQGNLFDSVDPSIV